jgi:putative transposase
LAAQVQYLKAENEVLRSKLPKRVPVTPAERQRLVKLGRQAGAALKHLITIVTYRTFLRWANGSTSKTARPTRRPGRPRTPGKD